MKETWEFFVLLFCFVLFPLFTFGRAGSLLLHTRVSLDAVCGLLVVVASLVVGHGPQGTCGLSH